MFNLIILFIIPCALFMGGLGLLGEATSNAKKIMDTSSIIPYVLGGIGCWILLIGYIYFLYRLIKPDRDKTKNRKKLLDELCEFACSDNYICISIKFDRMPTEGYSGLYYSLGHGGAWFNFYRHGYADLGRDQILSILRTLESKLNGYLKIHYEEIGGYDPTISVTHGTTPGGGDGYYISSKGYGTANIERAAYLYLGENARKQRQADRDRAVKRNSLKRI